MQNVGGMTLYRFTMIDNGTCVRDLVPCKRLTDGAIGLLDLVEGGFYTSPNGVVFNAGESISTEKNFEVLTDGSVRAR
jgi:hypothetical protein